MVRQAYAISDKGLVRDNNEDNLYLGGRLINSDSRDAIRKGVTEEDLVAVYAVCDGVGGEAFGEKASLLCATKMFKIQKELVAITTKKAAEGVVPENSEDRSIQDIINQNLQESGREIQGLVNPQNMHQYSGTTVAGIVFIADTVHLFHIGDSRIYRIRNRKLERMTIDHTEAERMVRMQMLAEEDARKSPKRHVLTRCLGVGNMDLEIEADFTMGQKALPGDIYLLCSDGLTDMVPEETIVSAFECYNIPSASAILVKEALKNGGEDNITLLVVEVNSGIPFQNKGDDGEVHIEKSAKSEEKKGYKLWLVPTILTFLILATATVVHFANPARNAVTGKETSQAAMETSELAPVISPHAILRDESLPASTPTMRQVETTALMLSKETEQTTGISEVEESTETTATPVQTTRDVLTEELPTTYIVQAKDGLMNISRKFYGSPSYYRYIMEKNGITDVDSIEIGQVLTIYPLK